MEEKNEVLRHCAHFTNPASNVISSLRRSNALERFSAVSQKPIGRKGNIFKSQKELEVKRGKTERTKS